MTAGLQDVIGDRGEKIVGLCLTNYEAFAGPLFRPGFLGEKWPSVDFYVELPRIQGSTPYFFVQAKTTAVKLPRNAISLPISTKRRDIERLLRMPGQLIYLEFTEPTQRVFVRSVHTGVPALAIHRIPLSHELTTDNLRVLRDEVLDFWKKSGHKPTASKFS